MMSKFSPWLLVSGLALACPAIATEKAPADDAAPQSSSMKVGIDPITGKRRVLSVEESAALDVQVQSKAGMRAARASGPGYFPATIAESMANARTVNGITGMKPTADQMSSLHISRDASGKVTIQHADPTDDAAAPSANATEELPSE